MTEDYDEDELFTKQEGKCAVCRIEIFLPCRYNGDQQAACLDHDHKTGKIRGLLCHGCNLIIGRYEAILERDPQFDTDIIPAYIQRGKV